VARQRRLHSLDRERHRAQRYMARGSLRTRCESIENPQSWVGRALHSVSVVPLCVPIPASPKLSELNESASGEPIAMRGISGWRASSATDVKDGTR